MKKVILTMAAVFALTFANAQDKKEKSTGGPGFSNGDLYLTGTANFSSDKTGDQKSDGFTLSPGAGYFVTDNIAIEGMLSYKSTTTNSGAPGASDVKDTGFGVAAGAKYLFTPANAFSLSLGARLSYMSTKVDNGFTTGTDKEIGFKVPLGLHYFVSNNFAITSEWGGLGYTSNDNGGNGADKTNKISLGLDLSSISFGLLYKL